MKKHTEKHFIRKSLLLAAMFLLLGAFPAFAGEWVDDETGRWYRNEDETYPTDGWLKIKDAWYYFNESGYLYRSCVTPDGYKVDKNGKRGKRVDASKAIAEAAVLQPIEKEEEIPPEPVKVKQEAPKEITPAYLAEHMQCSYSLTGENGARPGVEIRLTNDTGLDLEMHSYLQTGDQIWGNRKNTLQGGITIANGDTGTMKLQAEAETWIEDNGNGSLLISAGDETYRITYNNQTGIKAVEKMPDSVRNGQTGTRLTSSQTK